MKCFIAVLAVIGCAFAYPRIVKRDSNQFAYELPSNASIIVGPINTGFDCVGLQYGYYADQANDCKVFHVCLPYEDPQGNQLTRHFSFICGEGTIFDQSQLVCNFPEFSLPCDAASGLYNINDYFGREDLQFRNGFNDIFKK